MPLDEDRLIQRKILRLRAAQGGFWPEAKWVQIDAGPLHLADHRAILVEQGHVQDDPVRRRYLLTARGWDGLKELDGSE